MIEVPLPRQGDFVIFRTGDRRAPALVLAVRGEVDDSTPLLLAKSVVPALDLAIIDNTGLRLSSDIPFWGTQADQRGWDWLPERRLVWVSKEGLLHVAPYAVATPSPMGAFIRTMQHEPVESQAALVQRFLDHIVTVDAGGPPNEAVVALAKSVLGEHSAS